MHQNKDRFDHVISAAEMISYVLDQPFSLHVFLSGNETLKHKVIGLYENPLDAKRHEAASIKKANTVMAKKNSFFLEGMKFKQFYPEGAYKTLDGQIVSVHSGDSSFDQYVGFILADLVGAVPFDVVHRIEFLFLAQISYLYLSSELLFL